MSQSLSKIYVHLTFGTKFRQPFITEDIEEELHSVMAGIFKKCNSPALIINSVPDHTHVLFRMSKNHALSAIVRRFKTNSSKWIKVRSIGHQDFRWQVGYGAFSVSSSGVEVVRKYIAKQKEHHKVISYKEEIELFIKKYDLIEYNSEYYWD